MIERLLEFMINLHYNISLKYYFIILNYCISILKSSMHSTSDTQCLSSHK